jgi:2-oxo-4-hydroxy-4-carboxy-5-ureidoimidazoline decarboxylase
VSAAQTVTMQELDSMEKEPFVAAVGWVFEHSPWVAERAWAARPFGTVAALHGAMAGIVAHASRQEQLALIREHPDLGVRARISPASAGEQAGAGLDRLTAGEFERLHRLNSAYREKFGFPFIYAVKGSTKGDILAALEHRLAGEPDAERATALAQIFRIAQFRLEDTISCAIS